MSLTITLQVPEIVAQRARAAAVSKHRKLEEVLVEWLDRAAAEPPLESLSNEQILVLCDLQLEAAQQVRLSELLTCNREGHLVVEGQRELDDLLTTYRHGLVRKANAWRVAVQRGLRAPLN